MCAFSDTAVTDTWKAEDCTLFTDAQGSPTWSHCLYCHVHVSRLMLCPTNVIMSTHAYIICICACKCFRTILHFCSFCVALLFSALVHFYLVIIFLLSEVVLLSVGTSLFSMLHGSVHAAVLSLPPAGVWLAPHCFLSWTMLPSCAAFTLQP